MKIIWRKKSIDQEVFNIVKDEYKKSDLVATLVANKEVGKDEIESFLNPKIEDFYSPFDLLDMDIAVKRILKAIENNENILIYGDYDVDGMTSTTILFKFLLERGLNPKYYIPNKIEEGYGFSIEAIDEIIGKYTGKEKIDLIITVDCGITSIKEVEYAKTKNIDVIITDHHEPQEELPKAIAIVNPKRHESKAKFRELAGVGVVFKLLMALTEKLKLDKSSYMQYIDLVALGTISDIVPMLSENRIIEKYGLEEFKKSKNPAISVLYDKYNEGFNESTISFQIAPRINASGRLGQEDIAMKFLLSKTQEEAEKYFYKLDEINQDRRILSDNIFKEALKIIEEKELDKNSVIVLEDKSWHSGVTGIVASKIVDIFKKPTIVFSIEGDLAKGSGRTVPGINIYDLTKETTEIIEEFGGHEKAVGLTLNKKNLDKFKEIIDDKAKKTDIEIIEEYDYELSFDKVDYDILDSIGELAPFGEKNLKPDFLFKRVEVLSANVYGNMLKLNLRQNGINLVGIGFGLGEKQKNIKTRLYPGDKIYLIGKIEENIYMDKSSIQINIREYNLLKNKI